MRIEARFRLRDTLHGGQSFRWREAGRGLAGTVGATAILVEEHGEAAEASAFPREHEGEVARFFRLDDPYTEQLRRLRRDSALRGAIDRYEGLRLLRQDPWEALAAFIVSANNHVPRIEGILDRIALAAGTDVRAPWGIARAFPGPRAVARLGASRLRRLGCGYRAPYLESSARTAGWDLDLAALRKEPRESAREALLELPGVGPKVADCVLAFALDHTTSFPVDRHVERAVRRLDPSVPPGAEAIARWARKRWGANAALAQQFLFHAERLARPHGPAVAISKP